MTGNTNQKQTYFESFEKDAGGWWGFAGNQLGLKPLEKKENSVITRSPWWIDYNHAPPGAGYIHMLACLNTHGFQTELLMETGGNNRFIEEAFPTDFTNAKITLRSRGELLNNGAEMVLLVQSHVEELISGWMFTENPFQVTEDFTSQSITLSPDPELWTCLGARHDRTKMYGEKPLSDVLSNVNVNIMLVLFPLDIQPMGEIAGDPHQLRAEKDYPVWRSQLPEGYIEIDEVKIEFS